MAEAEQDEAQPKAAEWHEVEDTVCDNQPRSHILYQKRRRRGRKGWVQSEEYFGK